MVLKRYALRLAEHCFRRRQIAVSDFVAYGYIVASRVKHGVAITTPDLGQARNDDKGFRLPET